MLQAVDFLRQGVLAVTFLAVWTGSCAAALLYQEQNDLAPTAQQATGFEPVT